MIGFVESSDKAKDRRLSAARGPKEREKLSIPDVQGNVVHRLQRSKPLDDVFKLYVNSVGSWNKNQKFEALNHFSSLKKDQCDL